MREIIFRGRRIDNGEWVEGFYQASPSGNHYIISTIGEHAHTDKVYPTTICQYTGQTDKNGKRIFDGDIVYWPYEDENGEVFWDEDGARFGANFPGVYADFDNFYGHELEVVGNVYDNPEMRWAEHGKM